MKWWFKVNRNNLYRKYNFDPHDFILKSFKIDKSFKFLITKKKYNFIILKRRKKLKLKWRRYSIKKKRYYRRKLYNRRSKRKKKLIKISYNKKWYSSFWKKLKINYFIRKRKIRVHRRKKKRLFKARFIIRKNRRKNVGKILFRVTLEKRKRRTKAKKRYKTIMRKIYFQAVWLFIKKFRKKKKDWWLIRINLRKTAIYYGFTNLKKFRFVNKYADKSMSIKTYHNDKLENMLNIFLLKIGLFDNIFVSNNFIKASGYININFKKVFDPYRYVHVKDIVSFINIKKIQNIYKKRCMFSKSFYLKKYKKSNKLNKNVYSSILVKIIYNVPKYIHYDYQIMCFCIYRLPNRKELFSANNKLADTWAIDTRLKYN